MPAPTTQDRRWVQDYGSPHNRGVMYVPVAELVQEAQAHLSEGP